MEMPYRLARKIVIAVVGGTTILIGIIMLALPGPGVLVLSLGLATLAIEFAFARRWLAQLKRTAKNTYDSFAGNGTRSAGRVEPSDESSASSAPDATHPDDSPSGRRRP